MIKNYESAHTAGKNAIDACAELSSVLTRGWQEIGSHFWTLAQNAVDIHTEHARALAAITSPQEWLEQHAKWANRCFEAAQSGSARFSEISAKTAGEAAAPVQSHFYNFAACMTGGVNREAA